jgi:hypothetical protein
VKLQYFKYARQTKIKKKTLKPKWNEEFLLYVPTWTSPQVALIKVLDHDDFSRVSAGRARFRRPVREDWCFPSPWTLAFSLLGLSSCRASSLRNDRAAIGGSCADLNA